MRGLIQFYLENITKIANRRRKVNWKNGKGTAGKGSMLLEYFDDKITLLGVINKIQI